MDKYIFYIIFMIFNVIFGLSGLAVLGSGVFLIIKIEFNQYIIIIICFGGIMLGLFSLGLFVWKRIKLLIVYLIFICIITIIEFSFSLFIKFHKGTNNFIKNSIKEITEVTEEQKDEIINISFIIVGSAAGCGLLSFFFAFILYKKLKGKSHKYKNEDNKGDDILKGLDYTNLDPDISTI